MISTWILYCLIVSASLGLAALAGERALSQYRKPVRWVWFASIAGSILLPLGMLVAPLLMRAMSPVMSADAGAAVYLPALLSTSPDAAQGAGVLNAATVSALLAWAWGLSVAFVGLRLAATYSRLRREMKSWTPGRILDAPVLLSDDRGPAVIGVRRSVIVMPEWIAEMEQRLLRLVFLHEREHQRAGDHRLFAFGIAALLAMPWNPITWWQLKRLRLAIEFDCDRRVLDQGVDAREYAEALLVVGSRVSGPLLAAASFAERKPSVERRLRRMTEPLRRLRGPRAILATGVGVLGIMLACGSPIPIGPGGVEDASPQAAQTSSPDVVASDNADPSAGPAFIPYDKDPVLQNAADVSAALQEHYPQDLKDAGVGGRVEVWLLIGETGEVMRSQVETSSGNPSLDEAAQRVASEMRFSPAGNNGVATAVWVPQQITFQLPPTTPTFDDEQLDKEQRDIDAALGPADGDAPLGGAVDPLIVIDGVIQAGGASLEELNALDIDSIEIIKGQAGRDLYGERAQDGVIEIATRGGAFKVDRIVVTPTDPAQPTSDRDSDNDKAARNSGGPLIVIDGVIQTASVSSSDDDETLETSGDPLIVIDGVIQATGASLEDLNALDIDSIEIVKGEAALGLYGDRARNGAIQITTKGGGRR